jgi:hypothetical protein
MTALALSLASPLVALLSLLLGHDLIIVED